MNNTQKKAKPGEPESTLTAIDFGLMNEPLRRFVRDRKARMNEVVRVAIAEFLVRSQQLTEDERVACEKVLWRRFATEDLAPAVATAPPPDET